jgi:hypothetical protein
MTITGRVFLGPLFGAVAAFALFSTNQYTALAQTTGGLINISTPDITAPKTFDFRADARIFGGDEDATYFGAGIRYGLSNNWEVGVGTSMAQFHTFNLPGGGVVRHAGSDLEFSAKYSSKQSTRSALSAEVGVALPNTPAQNGANLTLGATGSLNLGGHVSVYANPRAVFVTDNTIVGLGLGAKARIAHHVWLIADYTPILTGANTIDIGSGTQRSHDIYGAALRFSTNGDNLNVDLGWTNGTGFTTGSSLTPGLGNSSAFYITLNFKR